jgi:hypothetical protein
MGRLELCRFLGCRLVQYQHLDDFFVQHRRRSLVVAVMDLCLGKHTRRLNRQFRSLTHAQLGYSIAACFVCLTGRIGATYHISFPVVNRASFGIWGALWPVFNRAAMACIWYGVQSWIGGTCVYLMIRSIWNSWRNVCMLSSLNLTTLTCTGRWYRLRWHQKWHP